jgi:putative oxidoreductase
MAAGLLIARLIVGIAMAGHGSQKLFGWFGGHGPAGTGGFFEQLGWRPGAFFAVAAGLAELGGGLLTALGLLNPIGPALVVMVMIVASLAVHRTNGFWATNGGWELNGAYVAAALALAFAGPGAYSLDALIGFDALGAPVRVWIVLAIAVVLALGNVAVRRPAPAAASGA